MQKHACRRSRHDRLHRCSASCMDYCSVISVGKRLERIIFRICGSRRLDPKSECGLEARFRFLVVMVRLHMLGLRPCQNLNNCKNEPLSEFGRDGRMPNDRNTFLVAGRLLCRGSFCAALALRHQFPPCPRPVTTPLASYLADTSFGCSHGPFCEWTCLFGVQTHFFDALCPNGHLLPRHPFPLRRDLHL